MSLESSFSLFVADLHLSPRHPRTAARFLSLLENTANGAAAVYILGDLFELWPGDDCLTEAFPHSIAAALRRLSERDTRVFVLHGNRDFLLGPGFFQASGARPLSDPSVIDLHGQPTLILHGDSLCTDDEAYQQFRRRVRDPAWQQAILAKPLSERLNLARQLREQSENAKIDKAGGIMDVNAEAVAAALRASGCRRMIHGHTHRPARHLVTVDGKPCERWVLPDWYESDGGGYLRCDAQGCQACGI